MKIKINSYPILGGTFALELDGSIAGSKLPFPPLLGWDNSDAFLFTRGQYATCLPPFVIRSVRYMEDISVAEEETSARQSIVLVGVVVKECPIINYKFFSFIQSCSTKQKNPD